jgi:hypothetical protein
MAKGLPHPSQTFPIGGPMCCVAQSNRVMSGPKERFNRLFAVSAFANKKGAGKALEGVTAQLVEGRL